jgi:hypothetical protein
MSGVIWDNNLLKRVVNKNEYVGIGIEFGARDMQIYNNTIMSQWPTAGYAFGAVGGSMADNYACLITPSRAKSAYFGDSNGKSTTTYLRDRISGSCPDSLRSLANTLGPVTNQGVVLTATAVETVEFGTQGVVFAGDGRYVSAVVGSGPYTLSYGAPGVSAGSHTVTATVVDVVGLMAVSGNQSVSTSGGVGPGGRISPNVDPAKQGLISPVRRTIQLTAGIKNFY